MLCQGEFENEATCAYGQFLLKAVLIIVPYMAKKDFPITSDYTIPKGMQSRVLG